MISYLNTKDSVAAFRCDMNLSICYFKSRSYYRKMDELLHTFESSVKKPDPEANDDGEDKSPDSEKQNKKAELLAKISFFINLVSVGLFM